jgi:hypothetical protein
VITYKKYLESAKILTDAERTGLSKEKLFLKAHTLKAALPSKTVFLE